jgi:hypothetical protein
VFIQFSGAVHQAAISPQEAVRCSLFTKHLVSMIKRKFNIADLFQRISDSVYQESKYRQKPVSMNGLNELSKDFLIKVISGTYAQAAE